jgi:alpha-beta hydrolase superfamily lysophospholipase
MKAAQLTWTTDVEAPQAVVLVLPGGTARSHRPASPAQLAVLRMAPFARSVAHAGAGRVGVARLRYAVRGWNGTGASAIGDTGRALDQIAALHPGVAVGLLGHSMGGRVALHLSADERIAAIAVLAPWVERADQPRTHQGLQALFMHGTRDRITSAKASRAMADAMRDLGAEVTYESVADTHGMLRQARQWHERSAGFLVDALTCATKHGG